MTQTPPPLPAHAAHNGFVANAGPLTEGWRTGLGAALFVLAFVFLPPLFVGLFLPEALQAAFYDGTTRTGVLLQFGSMILPLLALRLIMIHLHQRGLWSLAGPPVRTVQSGIATAWVLLIVLAAQTILPPWPTTDTFSVVRPILPWLLTLPLALVVVLVQVTVEELFFRGYLQQQIAARTRDPLFWMILPSVLFGAAHYFNADGPAEGVLWALWAALLGIACADLTARAGSIGPSVGLHFVNNLFALLLFGMENGPSSGLALFLTPYVDPAGVDQNLDQLLTIGGLSQVLSIALTVTILWLGARVAIRR